MNFDPILNDVLPRLGLRADVQATFCDIVRAGSIAATLQGEPDGQVRARLRRQRKALFRSMIQLLASNGHDKLATDISLAVEPDRSRDGILCKACGGCGWLMVSPPAGEPAGESATCSTCKGTGRPSLIGVSTDHVWLDQTDLFRVIWYPVGLLSDGQMVAVMDCPPTAKLVDLNNPDPSIDPELVRQMKQMARPQIF